VADEAVVGQDAAQVVTFEHDAEQVERLALEPVGRVPEGLTEATTGKSSSGEHAHHDAGSATDSRCDTTAKRGTFGAHFA
jgi:hypothetical protein